MDDGEACGSNMLLFLPFASKLKVLKRFESGKKCLELKDRAHSHSSLPFTPISQLSSPPVDKSR